ncbi:MAG: hypothetical protein KKE86_11060 [Planctomycetes bacterium]|nr:hypothetical protein [Planctomycetota bacterium]MBU4399859.1 hypothetical protein [Planctomycetota bacterium]MCG2683521.1 hypothetical protein [Planctomycetales bacterium]
MPTHEATGRYLASVTHVANLGKHELLRIVESTEVRLVVETKADRQARILTLDMPAGDVALGKTNRPRLGITSSYSGTRWISVKHKKRPDGLLDSFIQWQDDAKGRVYDAVLTGEETTCTSCPPNSDKVFVGTRRNAREGKGHLRCLCHGELVWTFTPSESGFFPGWWNPDEPPYREITAYPYALVGHPDARYVAFSSFHFLYIVDQSGRLVALHTTPELFDATIGERPTCENGDCDRSSRDSIEIDDELWECFSNRTTNVPQPEHPYIAKLGMPANGAFLLANASDMLFWFSEQGQLAHWQQMECREEHEMLDKEGRIIMPPLLRLKISQTGRWIAAQYDEKIWLLRDGAPFSSQEPGTRDWDIDTEHQIIAFVASASDAWGGSASAHTLKLVDLRGRVQSEIALDAPNRVFSFSDDGRFLVTEGESCPVFQLSYSPTPVKRVLFIRNRNARTPELPVSSSFPEKEREPDWIVQPDMTEEDPEFRVSSDAHWVVVTYGTKIDLYQDEWHC